MGDDHLLARWSARRDEAAFRELCDRHAALVTATARRLGSPDRDEAAQAVFLLLADKAGSVGEGLLAGWLVACTRRVVANQRRARERRRQHEQGAAEALARQRLPAAEPGWSDARRHLDEALASLSPARREAVVRFYLEGKPQAEVAAELGCSVDAVKTRIHEGLAKLRDCFARRGVAIGTIAIAAGLSEEAAAVEPVVAAQCTQAVLAPGSAPGAAALAAGSGSMAAGAIGLAAAAAIMVGAALGLAASGAATATATGPPSEDRRAAILHLVDIAVQHGLPEAHGARLLSGTVATRDGSGGGHGVHLRLADGRWLVQEGRLVPAAEAVCGPLHPVDSLLAGAERAPGRPADPFELIASPARAGLARTLTTLDPVGIPATPLMALLALRAGVKGSDAAWALAAADESLLRFRPGWEPRPIHFGIGLGVSERRWRQRNLGRLEPLDEIEAARLTLIAWFDARLQAESADGPDREHWLAGLIALADPAQHDGIRSYADALTACDNVPEPGSGTDLASQLPSWPLHGPTPDHALWPPATKDLTSLVRFAGDRRPALREGGAPRSAGDQALACIGRLLAADPRPIIGRDPDAPWTDSEREATAGALQSWLNEHPSPYVDERTTGRIGQLPPDMQLRIVIIATPERREVHLARIAAAWMADPPDLAIDARSVAALLRLADGHPAFAALMAAWPADGPAAPLVACWRDRHGDPGPLDALLARSLDDPAALPGALGVILGAPEPRRLAPLLAIIDGPPGDPRRWPLLATVAGSRQPARIWEAAQHYRRSNLSDSMPWSDLRTALALRLLDDRRPTPPEGLICEPLRDALGGHAGWRVVVAGRIVRRIAQAHADPPIGLSLGDVATIAFADADPWATQAELAAAAAGLRRRWNDPAANGNQAGDPHPGF